jgi:maleylpyruvate isomerase
MSQHFDPSTASAEINAATERLLLTVHTMADADVAGRSLLPGWSRGHVLTHLARNADGLINLLAGAAEGVERKAYASQEARTADIEAGSGRALKERSADIEGAHTRFLAAVAAVPPAQWEFVLHWGSAGETRPASAVLDARLREVAIHHLDLDFGYTAAEWSPEFALRILRSALPAFEVRGLSPCTLLPTDVDARIDASGGSDLHITGPAHALATWLLGRDAGSSLATSGGELPTPPAWK